VIRRSDIDPDRLVLAALIGIAALVLVAWAFYWGAR